MKVSRLVRKTLQDLATGGEDLVGTARIVEKWEEIVGATVARRAWPSVLAKGTLQIRTDGPVWANELRLLESTLLEKLAQALPKVRVQRLNTRAASPDEVEAWQAVQTLPPGTGPSLSTAEEDGAFSEEAALPPEDLAKIDELLDGLPDSAGKEVLLRFLHRRAPKGTETQEEERDGNG